ncbi:uncharacterized protein PG998_014663 [Apiospora kogelbergensis]|uniref:uncharacterized protein n=1 Tax=Apiospora kogelbergensis TaxID=1337665 RepID=UPI00312E1AD5
MYRKPSELLWEVRSGDVNIWPWKGFEAIAALSQLVLTDAWLDPDITTASNIFRFMMEEKEVGQVKLEGVTFWIGN